MDPAAVKELQRLYAKKLQKEAVRPAKRRKVEEVEELHVPDESDDISEAASSSSFADFEEEETDEVEEVVFHETDTKDVQTDNAGFKAFMSGKVPKVGPTQLPTRTEDDEERDALKKDIELQKLLRESHLLADQGTGSLSATGKTRHKAVAMHLIHNGAKPPPPEKMSMTMRCGIKQKQGKQLAKKEKEEKEAGIVTAKKATVQKKKKSNKLLHELNLGKYKHGKLSITRSEINRIQKPTKKGKKKGFSAMGL